MLGEREVLCLIDTVTAVMSFRWQINTEDDRFIQLFCIIPRSLNLHRLLEPDLRSHHVQDLLGLTGAER